MKIRPKRPDDRSGHGIVTDLRGRIRLTGRAHNRSQPPTNPWNHGGSEIRSFSTPPSRGRHPHRGDAATKHSPKVQRTSCNT
jgi:hypothetical protein